MLYEVSGNKKHHITKNNQSKIFYIILVIAWLSTSIAIVAGIYFTKSVWCLLAFCFPTSISVKDDGEKDPLINTEIKVEKN